MCAIVGSFDPQTIIELVRVNSYRGNFSWSITGINESHFIIDKQKGFGEFPEDLFLELTEKHKSKDLYWLCHVQAPTGGMVEDVSRIHPARRCDRNSYAENEVYLWHNGVIKTKWMDTQPGASKFDTQLMVDKIVKNDQQGKDLSKALYDIDGSFACALLWESCFIRIFRNTASPMFVNGTDISSVKYKEMEKIESGVIYDLNVDCREITVVEEFDNVNKPFFFG